MFIKSKKNSSTSDQADLITIWDKISFQSADTVLSSGLTSAGSHHSDEDVTVKKFLAGYITNSGSIIQKSKEWDELASAFATPLLASDWFISAAKAFCPPNKLLMLTLKSESRFKAIIPLCLKGRLLSHLEFVGSSTLREPGGVLFDNRESLKTLIQIVLNAKKSLILKRLYKSSPEVSILNRELKTRPFRYTVHEERIPYVDTTGDWEKFRKNKISSSRRSGFRRMYKKAAKKGELRFEVVTPGEDDLDSYLQEAYRIEAANWKGRMGTAVKTHASLRKFFRYYSERTAKKGNLHLFFLKAGEENIAVQITVIHSNRLWIYKIGYDEEWSWCSPGTLLMHNVVRFCFENNLESCEFLGYDEQWLHIWATGFHDLVSFGIYPKSVTGWLVNCWDHLRTFYHDKMYKWRR